MIQPTICTYHNRYQFTSHKNSEPRLYGNSQYKKKWAEDSLDCHQNTEPKICTISKQEQCLAPCFYTIFKSLKNFLNKLKPLFSITECMTTVLSLLLSELESKVKTFQQLFIADLDLIIISFSSTQNLYQKACFSAQELRLLKIESYSHLQWLNKTLWALIIITIRQ